MDAPHQLITTSKLLSSADFTDISIKIVDHDDLLPSKNYLPRKYASKVMPDAQVELSSPLVTSFHQLIDGSVPRR